MIGSKSQQLIKSMKTQSANAAKSIAYKTSIETDNKIKTAKTSTSATLHRTKVPISLSSATRTSTKLSTNKSDETVSKPQIDNKKIVKRSLSKSSEGNSRLVNAKQVRSSIEPKLQKQMKDTMNESSTTASGSTSASASGSSSSTRRSVRSAVMVSRKTDKEKTNMKLSEKKGSSTTSTVRVHREPVATTSAVSTVLVDDDSEMITIRSIKSSDSTKSSTSSSSGSGSNSRKVLTSEVFTKTFGTDKPLEVVYRQPDFDVEHHTMALGDATAVNKRSTTMHK